MEIKNTRPYEAILISSAIVVYVVRRLLDVHNHMNNLVQTALIRDGVSLQQMEADSAGFSYSLNVTFPIIAGAVLLIGAWLVFHLMVCPRIALHKFDKTTAVSIALSLLIIFASLFLFHYYREYILYRATQNGNLIGLKVYSLYRKKTLLGDAIGICFLFVFFELVSSSFRYMQRQLLTEKVRLFSIVALVLPFIPAGVLFYLAMVRDLPTPLWSGDTCTELLWAGSIVIVWALQAYIIKYLLPNLKGPISLLLQLLLGFVAIWLLVNALIWAAYTNFYFYYHPSAFFNKPFLLQHKPFLLQLIRTLFPTIVFAVFRSTILKEKVILQQQVAGTSAELAQLRSQINPHFLFNALNSLYAAAMKEKSEKTADGIQRLGDMMRFMLQENNQERISIEKEIEYLHNYIHLQRIRIDETQGIDIRVVLNQPDTEVYIAPMMLIPFVENAFKHGISHRFPSWIFITLSFDATHLYFRVQNARHIRQEANPEEYQSGIGLQNLRKRLTLMYPGRHTLQVQESDHDYIAALTLTI